MMRWKRCPRLRKRATVAELVTRASGRRPLLLAIEDLHWADQMTLDHLANLAETVAGCPALLVMTSRLERDPLHEAWGPTTRPADRDDRPRPASAERSQRPAEAYFDALGELAQRCVERADGNPLFLEQLLRHAEESAEGVPGSIRSLVQARLDRLALPDKRALQAASVLGQRFTAEALAVLLDRPGGIAPTSCGISLCARRAITSSCSRADPGGRLRRADQAGAASSPAAADWFRSRDLTLCAAS
jgi:hypothetical protein